MSESRDKFKVPGDRNTAAVDEQQLVTALRSPLRTRDGLAENGKDGDYQFTSNCLESHDSHSLEKSVLADFRSAGARDYQNDLQKKQKRP